MKRLASILVVLACLVPLMASAQSRMTAERLWMRNTTATGSTSTFVNDWNVGSPGTPPNVGFAANSFTDSLTFAHGASGTTAQAIDTTAAYPLSRWPLPPTYPSRGSAIGARATKHAAGAQEGYTDSLNVDSLDVSPWIVLRVRQDSLFYSSGNVAGGTFLDSAFVSAEWSPDGVRWFSVAGTSTRAFHASGVNPTPSSDYRVSAALVAVEPSPPDDYADIPLRCYPNLYTSGSTVILERTLCAQSGYIRFLVCVANDGYGQFGFEVLHW